MKQLERSKLQEAAEDSQDAGNIDGTPDGTPDNTPDVRQKSPMVGAKEKDNKESSMLKEIEEIVSSAESPIVGEKEKDLSEAKEKDLTEAKEKDLAELLTEAKEKDDPNQKKPDTKSMAYHTEDWPTDQL